MLTADELVNRSKSELDELFLGGETPDEDALDGETEGRVLAGRGPLRAEAVREAVNTSLLPWKGKRIDRGVGANRFGYGPLERQGFEFETRIASSLVPDDNDVLIFDYDQPENPPGVRRVRDDLKEVDDGLFLGTSNAKLGGGYSFVAYFALERTDRGTATEESGGIEVRT
ncbi:MAG: hypothetical protein ACI9QA_000873 [Methanobacteriota archaeon]|jgi:hypothetical protein|uniref:Uncharacterized protein n=1 Tax=Halorutilus salinus TaxID=2487751 RepID=A0A9Q4C492_9EURY|nr:hypothetical protein [Halorutilus salinus]MCX2819582.1 hypothetical protein [Halorutilus salinus]